MAVKYKVKCPHCEEMTSEIHHHTTDRDGHVVICLDSFGGFIMICDNCSSEIIVNELSIEHEVNHCVDDEAKI